MFIKVTVKYKLYYILGGIKVKKKKKLIMIKKKINHD